MAIAACDIEVRTEGVDGCTWTEISCEAGSANITHGATEPEFTEGMVGHVVRFAATGGAVAGLYAVTAFISGGSITLNSTPTDGEAAITGDGEMTVYPNGGGFKVGGTKTDYSKQDTPEVVFTDLACASNTTLTSATGGFGASDAIVGNLIYIGEGTNAVAGWYEITAWASTNSVTIDRTCASGGNMTAGVGNVGGGLRSPGQAAKLINTATHTAIAGHRIHIKSGTYTLTSADANVAGGYVNLAANMSGKTCLIAGYETTRLDMGARPEINCGSVAPPAVFSLDGAFNNDHKVLNVDIDGNGQNTIGIDGDEIGYDYASHCHVTNCDGSYGVYRVTATVVRVDACSGDGFNSCKASKCWAVGNGVDGYDSCATCIDCIASRNSAFGFGKAYYPMWCNCTAEDNGTDGFDVERGGVLVNCAASRNDVLGYDVAADTLLIGCASYNNTSGRINASYLADVNPINITDGDPFTTVGAVDPLDDEYAPNATALRGALLRGTAYGVAGQTDNRDIGAVQHADPAGGGGGGAFIIGG